MGAYLIRRLLLVIPTLWAIITINFFIVQIAPGGPVDQAIAAIELVRAARCPVPAAKAFAPVMRKPASAISATAIIAAAGDSIRR